jgi:transcription elongation factor Elf1
MFGYYRDSSYIKGVRPKGTFQSKNEVCPVCGKDTFVFKRLSGRSMHECTNCGFGGFDDFIKTIADKKQFYKDFLTARMETLHSLLPPPNTTIPFPENCFMTKILTQIAEAGSLFARASF